MSDLAARTWDAEASAGSDMLATLRAIAGSKPERALIRLECSRDTWALFFQLADRALEASDTQWSDGLGLANNIPVEMDDTLPFMQFRPVWSGEVSR
jgi:hypothetical protein